MDIIRNFFNFSPYEYNMENLKKAFNSHLCLVININKSTNRKDINSFKKSLKPILLNFYINIFINSIADQFII